MRIQAAVHYLSQGNRPAQEDHLLISEERSVFAVADGFGGPTPGAAAAQSSCEAVRDFLTREAGDLEATLPFVLRQYFSLAGNVLFNAVIYANRIVRGLNKNKGVHERGGASLIAGFMDGDLLAIASVGGCSAWLIREGEASELVTPKTYGRLTDPRASRAETTADSAPLMAVGITEDLEPEITEYRIAAGDWLILQTDGFGPSTRELVIELSRRGYSAPQAASELNEILKEVSSPENAAAAIIVF